MDDNLITPEETNAIDSTRNESPDVLDRLCEYDEDGQAGCRRTQTILALEEAYDTFVSPEMRWGYWDLFCEHQDQLYFDKTFLEFNIDDDDIIPEHQDLLNEINQYAGRDTHLHTMESLDALIKSDTAGLPTLIDETDRFYRCENVGTDMITTENITRERLDIIKDSFTDDVNPLLMDLEGSVYISDGKAICTKVFSFNRNPNAKLGVLLEDTANDVMNFYPFEPLTEEQEDFVNKLAQLDMQKDAVIIDL